MYFTRLLVHVLAVVCAVTCPVILAIAQQVMLHGMDDDFLANHSSMDINNIMILGFLQAVVVPHMRFCLADYMHNIARASNLA